jgi:signal transduction histidine kinase
LHPSGDILEVNLTGAAQLGTERTLLIRSSFARFVSEPDRGRFREHLNLALQTRQKQTCEVSMLRAGSTCPLHAVLNSVAVAGDEGDTLLRVFLSDVTEQKRVDEVRQFLSKANARLAGSLDYHTTLANIAHLCVPFLADWCVVDVLEDDGSIQRLVVAHVDRAKDDLARELQRRYPPAANPRHIVSKVISTGKSNIMSEVGDSVLVDAARDIEHLRILRELGVKSHMIVPLTARQRALGAITFVSAESGRRYGNADLALAEELAHRAGLAVENARLYRKAEEAATQERRHATHLQGLNRAALTINSHLTLKTVLQMITEHARELIGAHEAITSLVDRRSGNQLINAVSFSARYEAWRHYSAHPDDSGIYSLVMRTNMPVRMTQDELEAHPMWRNFGKEAGKHPPLRGWLAAPLIDSQGNNMGLIQLSDKYEGEFAEEDVAIAVQLAQMASVAVTNAHLYQEAQEAVTARDEFLSIASHELRTPLTSLILQLQNMLRSIRDSGTEGVSPQRLQTRLEGALTQSQRLARLVNELLDVSRITSGHLDLQLEEVDLAGVVREVLERFEEELQLSGSEVSVSIPLAVVGRWDRFRLDQVVTNLLSNAIKYGRGRRVEITIEATGDSALLKVRDEGVGIAAQDLERVFSRFEHAGSGRNYGGLGLGLYIVRRTVEAMGGSVRAESELGAGSTFVVELPLRPVDAQG